MSDSEVSEVFEQFKFEETPRIDKEAGIIYHAHVLGIKSAHGWDYDIKFMETVASKYEQMPVGLDHDYNSTPLKIKTTWGTLSNPTCDSNGIWADLHYLKSHTDTPIILEQLERNMGLCSLSPVNGAIVQRNKVITSFVPVRCDLVIKGATTKTILEQAPVAQVSLPEPSAAPQVEVKTVTFEQFNDLSNKLEEIKVVYEQKIVELEGRLSLHDKYFTNPKTSVQNFEQSLQNKGVDLKSFWKDEK